MTFLIQYAADVATQCMQSVGTCSSQIKIFSREKITELCSRGLQALPKKATDNQGLEGVITRLESSPDVIRKALFTLHETLITEFCDNGTLKERTEKIKTALTFLGSVMNNDSTLKVRLGTYAEELNTAMKDIVGTGFQDPESEIHLAWKEYDAAHTAQGKGGPGAPSQEDIDYFKTQYDNLEKKRQKIKEEIELNHLVLKSRGNPFYKIELLVADPRILRTIYGLCGISTEATEEQEIDWQRVAKTTATTALTSTATLLSFGLGWFWASSFNSEASLRERCASLMPLP